MAALSHGEARGGQEDAVLSPEPARLDLGVSIRPGKAMVAVFVLRHVESIGAYFFAELLAGA